MLTGSIVVLFFQTEFLGILPYGDSNDYGSSEF